MRRRQHLKLMGLLTTGLLLPVVAAMPRGESRESRPIRRFDAEKFVQLLDRQDVAGAIEQVELGWQRQYEDYYGGQLTLQFLRTAEISQRLQEMFRLTGRRSALIYVVPTPNQLELILLSPGAKPIHHRIASAQRDPLLQVVQALREGILRPTRKVSPYLKPAQQLYQWIVAPLEADLKAARIDTLVFCLGAGLRTVPMAALHDGQRFLVETYNLAIIPAFNLLDDRAVSLRDAKVLAMGASEFQEQPPLPSVPLELSAIATNLWPGEVLLNQNFTLANLRQQRQQQIYRIVHLATHADFATGSSRNSYIQFWDQRLPISLVETLNLRFPEVQLLVLSACRTALGDPQAELGFAGIAVMSGSQAALASLWSVSDVGTFLLMTEFYQNLKTQNKSQALRMAQIKMLKQQINPQQAIAKISRGEALPAEFDALQDTNFAHPFYWAAFTIIGNPW